MGEGQTIEGTPANRVCFVLFAFLVVSFLLEGIIEKIEHYLHKHHLHGMLQAMHKIKDEMMLLGFISLVLSIIQDDLAAVCMPKFCEGIPNLGSSCLAKRKEKWDKYCNDTSNSLICNNIPDCTATSSSSAASSAASSASSAASSASSGGSRRMLLGASSGPKLELYFAQKCDRSSLCCNSGIAGDYKNGCGYGKGTCEDAGMDPFVSINAMHNIHVLIFNIALVHVAISVLVMILSNKRVKRWHKIEKRMRPSATGASSVGHLHAPNVIQGGCLRCLCSCWRQKYIAMDTFTYGALRQYFIVRQGKKRDFNFHQFLGESLQHSFSGLVGITFWMWITLMITITFRSLVMDIAIGVYISVILVFIVGAKSDSIRTQLATDIYLKMDTAQNGRISLEDMTSRESSSVLKMVEPTFWCNSPKLMMTLIRLIIWLVSTEGATTIFYTLSIGKNSCFFLNRGWLFIGVNASLGLLVVLHTAINIVPTYAVLSHMGEHLVPSKLMRRFSSFRLGAVHPQGEGHGHAEHSHHIHDHAHADSKHEGSPTAEHTGHGGNSGSEGGCCVQ